MTTELPPLPEATLAPHMEMTQPPRPTGLIVMVDGKPVATVTLAHFFTMAKRVHRAQLAYSRQQQRDRQIR